MMDADHLELRVRDWMAADAAVMRTPPSLRRRVFDLPAMPAPRQSFLSRFSGVALSGGLIAAAVTAMVVTSMFFNLFDVPAGADGEPCNNRQIQRALDALRDAEGYRYVNREQVRQLDPDVELSFADPQFVWTDAWTSEGAYLAPDRVRDAPSFNLPSLYNRGYIEHLQVGGATYQLQEIDGVTSWVELENWPTANLVHGYVANAFPVFSIPGVTALEWRGTPVPDDLPGSGGCTAAAAIPADEPPGEAAPIPSHLVRERIVALRVDVGSGRPSTFYLGPSVTSREGDGDHRNMFELTWTTPAAEEFVAPTETVPDPNLGVGGTPEPSPTPLPPNPDAWVPVEMATGGMSIAGVVTLEDRFVGVGGSYSEGGDVGMVWTSTDGTTWEIAGDPSDYEGVSFISVAWDGEAFLAMGYRTVANSDTPGDNTVRPEAWVSEDGVTWEQGGEIGPAADTGEVANPGRPVAGGPGWVAGGSIWNLAANQQRPAFFTSPDGREWTTIELDDVTSGSLGTVVTLADGRLFAIGCESPSPTNAGQFGESCFMRPWHSDDGEHWTPGSTLGVEIGAVTRWGDQLIAVGRDADPGGQNEFPGRLMTSADGTTWTDLPGFDGGPDSVADIRVVGDELVIDGQITGLGTYPFATAWRSTDGVEWEPISLGLPTGGTGSFINTVINTPAGLVFLGQVQMGDIDIMPVMWAEP
jgi:hypothetical protein